MNENISIRKILYIFLAFLFFGTFGFFFLSGNLTLWEAFYSTTIVLLSHFLHGVEDPVPVQVLTIILILGSYFTLAYLLRLSADYLLGGEYQEHRRKLKMLKDVKKMEEHYIVCGFGRVGKQVCEDLFHAKVDFVVLDRDQREINRAIALGYFAIPGDPTEEGHLEAAGIRKSKALISCLGNDADNLFVTLTARALNPDLYIVARADDDSNTGKFEKAGANRVAIPYQIGGYHMATMALRPAVLDFLDVIVDSRHDELEVEELEIPRSSYIVGKKISEQLARDKTGLTILAINHTDGTSKVNPTGHEVVHAGDKLIVMGNRKQLDKMTELVA
jgi:voltage-gated potassium channel